MLNLRMQVLSSRTKGERTAARGSPHWEVLATGMTLPAFWIGVAALIGLDYAMGVWTHVRIAGIPVSGCSGRRVCRGLGVGLAVGRFGGTRTVS